MRARVSACPCARVHVLCARVFVYIVWVPLRVRERSLARFNCCIYEDEWN